jgi:hypothetical protein
MYATTAGRSALASRWSNWVVLVDLPPPMGQVKVPSIVYICLEPVTAMENENNSIHSLLPAVVLAMGRSTEM